MIAALAAAKEFIPRVSAFCGRLGESAETLLDYLRLDDEISLAFDALVHYAQRKSDEDTRVAAYQEMVSQVTRLAVELQSAAAFQTPELLAIPDETLEGFYPTAACCWPACTSTPSGTLWCPLAWRPAPWI